MKKDEEKRKTYYQLHRKQILQRQKEYNQRNKERISAYFKEYYAKNRTKILSRNRLLNRGRRQRVKGVNYEKPIKKYKCKYDTLQEEEYLTPVDMVCRFDY